MVMNFKKGIILLWVLGSFIDGNVGWEFEAMVGQEVVGKYH